MRSASTSPNPSRAPSGHVTTTSVTRSCELRAAAYRALERPEEARDEAAAGRTGRPLVPDPRQDAIGRHRTGYAHELERGIGLLVAGRSAETIRVLERMRGRVGSDRAIDNNLALAYMQLGQPLRAIEILEAALARDPDFFRLHVNLARAHGLAGNDGDLDVALRHLARAKELMPTDSRTWLLEAAIERRRGNLAAAIAAARQAVALAPDEVDPLLRLARLERQHGRPQDAIATCERALALDATSLSALVGLAEARMDLGDVDATAAALARVGDRQDVPAVRAARVRLEELRRRGRGR